MALIGYGLAGATFHAPVIAATPGLRLATIVTSNAERAAAARSRYEAVAIVSAVEDLWARADRHDLVVVAAHNRAHVPLGLAAIEAGLPVVIDKPVAPDSEGAQRLGVAARAARVPVVPFHNRRWDGDFLTLRRLLAEGELGDVLRYESRFERWRPTARPGARRQHAGRDEAGGVLFDLGAHLIDQALALFGPVVAVYAEIETRQPGPGSRRRRVRRALARVRRPFASVGQPHGRRSRPAPARAWVARGLREAWDGPCRRPSSRPACDPAKRGSGEEPRDAWGALAAGERSRPVPTEPGDYASFYAGVAATVRDRATPPVSLDDAVHGLQIIEAAFASSRAARVMHLTPGPGT